MTGITGRLSMTWPRLFFEQSKLDTGVIVESLFYLVLFAVALTMRLWDLDARAFHHDESLHAFYSYGNSQGDFYKHNPLTHGTFLFHLTGGTFALFGDSNFTARVPEAILGSVLVLLPFLLRPWIGRTGTAAAALMIAFSPSLLYYSRFIRNDIIIVFFGLLTVAAVWRYMRSLRRRWLYIFVASVSLGFTTKETQYIFIASLLVFLFVTAAPSLWLWVRGRRRWNETGPYAELFVLTSFIILPLFAASASIFQERLGIILAASDGTPGLPTGVPEAGAGITAAIAITAFLFFISIAAMLISRRMSWILSWLLFYLIFAVLFTNFFTHMAGLATGVWQSLGYWLAQHDVARGGQPPRYYLMLAGVYEFLPFILGLFTAFFYLYRETRAAWRAGDSLRSKSASFLQSGDIFVKFLIFWTFSSFVIYSIAGEKFPWLMVNIVIPLILLAGRGAGSSLASFWSFIRTRNFSNRDAVFTSGYIAIAVCITALAVLFTVRASLWASYKYADYPQELIIYNQSAHDAHALSHQITELGEETGLGYDIPLFISEDFRWPWQWYMRRYLQVSFRNTAFEPGSEDETESLKPVVYIVRSLERTEFEQTVDLSSYSSGYRAVQRHAFPESRYRCGTGSPLPDAVSWWCSNGGFSLSDAFAALADEKRRAAIWDYWLNRRLDGTDFSEELYVASDSYVYIRDTEPLNPDVTN